MIRRTYFQFLLFLLPATLLVSMLLRPSRITLPRQLIPGDRFQDLRIYYSGNRAPLFMDLLHNSWGSGRRSQVSSWLHHLTWKTASATLLLTDRGEGLWRQEMVCESTTPFLILRPDHLADCIGKYGWPHNKLLT